MGWAFSGSTYKRNLVGQGGLLMGHLFDDKDFLVCRGNNCIGDKIIAIIEHKNVTK